MNAPLRRVGIVIFVLFALLFANLNWVQGYKADSYRTSKYNGRVQLNAYQQQRGSILDKNGVVLARSVATKDTLKYQRQYPYSAMFEPVIGYRPVNGLATGVEGAEDSFLNGTATDRLSDLFFTSASAGDNVSLTMIKSVQQAAYNDLANNGAGGNVGAAVAIDPNTGAILAMASTPSFNPTGLVSHDTSSATHAYTAFNKQNPNPLVDRATQERYPPGSTFKVILSAAALSRGYTPQTMVPAGSSYKPVPSSDFTMTNAEAETCPQAQITLIQALTVSCNTAFAQLGVSLGSNTITQEAQAFGFGDDSLTLAGSGDHTMPVAASVVGNMTTSSGNDDPNLVAQSSIGQYQDQMTVMQGAMIAETVANGGAQMRPYLVQQIQDSDLHTTYAAQPSTLRTPISPQVAAELDTMMQSVVQNGTATSAQISGYIVAGKTGTAQNLPGAPNHRWFIGYASKDGHPIVAVAVLLVNAGNNGKKSAPKIAGDIMKAAITAEGK